MNTIASEFIETETFSLPALNTLPREHPAAASSTIIRYGATSNGHRVWAGARRSSRRR